MARWVARADPVADPADRVAEAALAAVLPVEPLAAELARADLPRAALLREDLDKVDLDKVDLDRVDRVSYRLPQVDSKVAPDRVAPVKEALGLDSVRVVLAALAKVPVWARA